MPIREMIKMICFWNFFMKNDASYNVDIGNFHKKSIYLSPYSFALSSLI